MEQKYDEVADEPCLDEDEKKTIKDEMGHLKDHWYTVTMATKAKRERCARQTEIGNLRALNYSIASQHSALCKLPHSHKVCKQHIFGKPVLVFTHGLPCN